MERIRDKYLWFAPLWSTLKLEKGNAVCSAAAPRGAAKGVGCQCELKFSPSIQSGIAAWDISPVDSSIYDCVYDREYPPVSLEQALLDLLVQSRSSDAGRPSYQVSDVIQIQDSLDQANKAFYVSALGLTEITFSPCPPLS